MNLNPVDVNFQEVSNFQKNIIGWAGIAITLIGGFVTLNNKVEANTLKVQRVEAVTDKLEKNNQNVSTQINSLRIEILTGFNDLKLQLKDKADREAN